MSERTHNLKTWPEPFQAIWNRDKRAEVRKDDRGYEVGDVLDLREWFPGEEAYSGRRVTARVSHIIRGPEWGLPEGMVVMSFHELGRPCAVSL